MAVVSSAVLRGLNCWVSPSTLHCPPSSSSRASSGSSNLVGFVAENFPNTLRSSGSPWKAGRSSIFHGCAEERKIDEEHPRRSGAGRVAVVHCSTWSRGRGRMFFVPFGRARHGSTFARKEWEKRNQAQQERLREMIERELKSQQSAGPGEERDSLNLSLLRELEKRLRAEEGFLERDGNGTSAQEESSGGGDSPNPGSGSSTYELIKELEKRLRTEREEAKRETRESPGGSEDLKTANYVSFYDHLKEWDNEMQEKRRILEEQWKFWQDGRNDNSTETGERKRNDEKRSESRQSWRRGVSRSERGHNRHGPRKQKPEENETRDAPPEYAQSNETVVYLKNEANGAEIYLVGTSHVSQKSVDEVREVIERVKPDFVMVELCRKRYEQMQRQSYDQNNNRRDSPLAFVEEMVRMLTHGDVGTVGKLVGFGLATFYRLLSYRGYHPGREFQVAIEEGKKLGAKIVLGDQDIDTTLKNLGDFELNMSIQDAFRFFGQRMPDDIANSLGRQSTSGENMFEGMRDRRVVRHFNSEMEKGAPRIFKVLVKDRNEVMMKALRNLKGKVVAVVGLAHVDGIEELWHKANEKYIYQTSQTKWKTKESTIDGSEDLAPADRGRSNLA